MKTIQLHGELAEKFGAHWNLAVNSPAEAFRAIDANTKGFLAHIAESGSRGVGYRIIIGKRELTVPDLAAPYGREVLHLVPVIGGAKSPLATIIIGALLIWATWGSAATLIPEGVMGAGSAAVSVGSVGFAVGSAMILGGVAQMLVKVPKAVAAGEATESKPSTYFNGPVNSGRQGSAVPVGYGRLKVGSIPISAGLTTENTL